MKGCCQVVLRRTFCSDVAWKHISNKLDSQKNFMDMAISGLRIRVNFIVAAIFIWTIKCGGELSSTEYILVIILSRCLIYLVLIKK